MGIGQREPGTWRGFGQMGLGQMEKSSKKDPFGGILKTQPNGVH